MRIDNLPEVRFFIRLNRAFRVLFRCFSRMYNALQNKLERSIREWPMQEEEMGVAFLY